MDLHGREKRLLTRIVPLSAVLRDVRDLFEICRRISRVDRRAAKAPGVTFRLSLLRE